MKTTFTVFFLTLCLCPAFAAPRAWTAKDGRVLQAEFVSATPESVTVKRADGVTLAIPLTALSEADVAWVNAQPKPVEITQDQLDKLVARFPAPASLRGREVTNDLSQLHAKYLSMVKFIRPNTVEPNLKMIRKKLADDIVIARNVAGTAGGDGTGKRLSGQSQAAENTILSARSALAWLEGPVTAHLQAYEELLRKK